MNEEIEKVGQEGNEAPEASHAEADQCQELSGDDLSTISGGVFDSGGLGGGTGTTMKPGTTVTYKQKP